MSNNPGGNTVVPLQSGTAFAYLNADYPLSITAAQPADGTAMTSWVNMAGQQLSYAQGTSANQPTFKTNVNAGKSGILFDGINDGISCTGSPVNSYVRYASNTPFSMFFTFRMLALTAGGMNLQSMRGAVATDKTTVGVDASSNLYWEVNNAGVITTIATPFTDTTKPHIIFVTNDGANGLTMYLDGVQIIGGTATSTTSGTANSVMIGNIPVAFSRPWNGYIYDHGWLSGVSSSAVRTSNTSYFSNVRGIAI